MKHIQRILVLFFLAVIIFMLDHYYFWIVMWFIKGLMYVGSAIFFLAGLYEISEIKRTKKKMNWMKIVKTIGTYVPVAILLFITAGLYFFIIRDGISSFYYPVVAILGAIGMPSITVTYYVMFIKKAK